MTKRYTLLYRPPSFCTLPKGWTLVERPGPCIDASWYGRRTDLPITAHRFGVVEFDRELSSKDIADYELKEVQ
jgi:hypothetical protein